MPRLPNRPWDDGRPLVLIVEADQSARELYSSWFSAQGFGVMCAVGIEGMSIALRHERPALIITELQARELTLTGLIARLQSDQSTRLIPILVLTSVTDAAAIRAAESATGVVAVLPKLADLGELRHWVEVLVPEVSARPRR
jgi:CheY-like chemotaxis protein